jgi:hypothetical protein
MQVRILCAAALALGLQVTGAHAQLTSTGLDCAAGSTFAQFEPTPLACSGAWAGNDASQQVSLMTQLELDFAGLLDDGASFAYLGKSDDAGSGPFVSNLNNATSGTLTFDVAQTGLFAVSLKAGEAFSVYLFDGGDAGLLSIDFSTLGVQVNENGIGAGLSHASLIDVNGGVSPPGGGVTPPIPEPETYALMLAGLGLVGFVAARRRRYS